MPKNTVMQQPRLNSSGFLLIQVLIATGIIAVATFALMTLMSQLNSSQRQITRKFEILDLEQALRGVLASQNFCRCNLGLDSAAPLTFPASIAPSDVVAINTPLRVYDPACNPATAQDLVTPNSEMPTTRTDLKIGDIELKNVFSLAGTQTYTADMEVDFDIDDGMGYRSVVISRILIRVENAGGGMVRIRDCSKGFRSESISVDGSTLADYHTGVAADCSNMHSNKFNYDSACNRWCGNGCTSAAPNCSGDHPGLGFVGGTAVECSGPDSAATCLCFQ